MVKPTQIFTAKSHPKKTIFVVFFSKIVFDSVCRIKNKDDKYYQQIKFQSVNMKKRKQRRG